MKSSTSVDTPQALKAFERLLAIMDELREKCPWDQQQTMESLRYLTIEETYELSEAIIAADMDEVKKELGDLLLHIVFFARIATEKQAFTITEVIQGLCEKLIYRHPHIYGEQEAKDSEAVEQHWERLKLKEKTSKSVLGGVPDSLPSLIKAIRIQEKARRVGFDWQEEAAAWQQVQEGMEELGQESKQPSTTSAQQEKVQEAFGDLLFALVNYASFVEVNPENALAKANKRFIQKFKAVEQQIAQQGQELAQLTSQERQRHWEQAQEQPLG